MKTNCKMHGKKIFFKILVFFILLTSVLLSVGTTYGKYRIELSADIDFNVCPVELDRSMAKDDETGDLPGIEEETPTTVYQVQPGDTLETIAEKFGITVEALAAYNGLDPDAPINPGTILHIPPTD